MAEIRTTGSADSHKLVELKNIVKNFGGVKALNGVSFAANAGEIHALVGENGAGKSTLMNILSGTYASGSFGGQIFWENSKVDFASPAEAKQCGITIIHQELSVFPHLSVAENMCVGQWPRTAGGPGLISWPQMQSRAQHWLNEVGAHFSVSERMGNLSTGNQQLVEIAKALSLKSKLLILDEPTSSLTPNEVEKLFGLLQKLKKESCALIYISHKLEEIFKIADKVTVLRDGQTVFTSDVHKVTEMELIGHMVGRSLDRIFPPRPQRTAEHASAPVVLKVEGMRSFRADNGRSLGPVSFEIGKGEILGFAGLLGAGRSEIAQALMGGLKLAGGQVHLRGEQVQFKDPRQALRSGIGLVGEDRKRESIFAIRSLDENVGMSRLATHFLGRILNLSEETSKSKTSLAQLQTRYYDTSQKLQELSGGNQQKVVIARILQMTPEVVILDEPTRGVDVGAKYEIYQILFELAMAGKACLVISSDLPELMGIADRILVMSDGQITGELAKDKFSQNEIMRLAIQKKPETNSERQQGK